MAIVIKPKRSETASSSPTVSDLAVGEIAINTADSKLYIRDSDDNIKSIGGANVIQFPYDDTDLGDLSYATQNSDLGELGGLVSYPDGNYDNLTVYSSLFVNGTEITGAGVSLTDLSVTTNSVGSAALSYNSSTGVFTYTPPDLSSFATESYVDNQILSVIDSAPGALDTLNELAAALGDDANFATTVTDSLASKASTGKAIAMAMIFGG